MSDPNVSAPIWSVADLIRGDYKPSKDATVILPLLTFDHEREGIDRSKVKLTHDNLKERQAMPLLGGPAPKLAPMPMLGSGDRRVLLNHAGLWESLCERGSADQTDRQEP